MPVPVIFDSFREAVAEGVHNLGADALKVALCDTAPDPAADEGFADLVEIAAGGGYTSGGVAAAVVSSAQTAGVYELELDPVAFAASGADIAAHRYAVLYNDTAAGKELIAFLDFGVSAIIADGNSETINAGVWLRCA